jgi:hypothetical protein
MVKNHLPRATRGRGATQVLLGSFCEPLVLSNLFAQDVVHQSACLGDFGAGDAEVQVLAFPPRKDDSALTQQAQVLGEVGLGQTGGLLQLSEAPFARLEQIQYLKALGV